MMAHGGLGRAFRKAMAEAGATRPRGISRRTMLLGAAAAPLFGLADAEAQGQAKVAVIGAGIAGLNAAYQLRKAGIRATIYEGSRRCGGRIYSLTGAVGPGIISELGGEFINSDHEDMLALAREFGLRLFNREEDAARVGAPQAAYFIEGRTIGDQELARALRPIARQIAQDARAVDRNFDIAAPPLDALSVEAYLDQYASLIPSRFVRTLIELTIRTEYGVEPAQSSALQLLFNLPSVKAGAPSLLGNSDELFVIEGGNSRLIDCLADALKGSIETNRALTRVDRQADRYILTFDSGHTEVADDLVIAIPFTVLRDVRFQDGLLPGALRRAIRTYELGANEKIIAGFTARPWRTKGAFSGEAWTDLGFAEAWDSAARQSERTDGALSFFLGGVEARAAAQAQRNGREFIRKLDRFAPGLAAASRDRFASTSWWTNRWSRGAYTTFAPSVLTGDAAQAWVEGDTPAETTEVRAGRIYFVGEHVSDAFYGFMNGGAETGRLAAQMILRRRRGAAVAGPTTRTVLNGR